MESFTVIDVKKTNFSNIFQLLYTSEKEENKLSRQDIAYKLNLSLPTVTQNLNKMLSQNLIIDEDKFSSKGGRKAVAYSLNTNVKYAIGVEMVKQSITIVSVDLMGNVIGREQIGLPFQNTAEYYKNLAHLIEKFILAEGYKKELILGVGVGVQGLISSDGTTVLYGEILNYTGLNIQEISTHLDYPCRFVHDAACVAVAEQWLQPDLKDAIVLSIGEHLGGALIMNGKLYSGASERSGAIEHTIINPTGPNCYCGKRGCVEVYCSLNALVRDFNGSIEAFMAKLHHGDKEVKERWNVYINYLAMAINNFHMVLGNQVIIGGKILNYLTEKDLERINELVKEKSAFPNENNNIFLGNLSKDAVAIGAAIPFFDSFLNKILVNP